MDIVSAQKRSRMMTGIRNCNTKPERVVRDLLHRAGLRYRLHCMSLPGKPDLWLARYHAVIEVNGCFWHGHNCHLFKMPSSRTEFWQSKIFANRARDERNLIELERLGIRRLTIWECALKGRKRHDLGRLLAVIDWWLSSGCVHADIAGGYELMVASIASRSPIVLR